MERPPDIVYKYTDFNIHSLLNLVSQSIYFSSPNSFNDPYDCSLKPIVEHPTDEDAELIRANILEHVDWTSKQAEIDYKNMPLSQLKSELVAQSETSQKEISDKIVSQMGISCFSSKNDNLTMWSHYGGNHNGFCLAFDTGTGPFTDRFYHVKYEIAVPVMNIVDLVINKNIDSIQLLFCTKSKDWKYEDEWRLFHLEGGTSYCYGNESLKAIYFGPEMSPQAQYILYIITRDVSPHVELYTGRRSDTEFKVDFFEYKPPL